MKASWLLLSSVLMLTHTASPALAKRAEPVEGGRKAPRTAASSSKKPAPNGRARPLSAHEARSTKAEPSQPSKQPASGRASKSVESAGSEKRAQTPRRSAGEPKRAPLAKQARSKRPCFAKPVQLVRVRGQQVEPRELSLTLCNGTPNRAALDALSVLARPRDVERPSVQALKAYASLPVKKGKPGKQDRKKKFRDPLFVTERVMRVHPGLLVRLQKVADHFPGKIIEIISGYRPDARDSSRHHHGRALDLRVAGVTREVLRDYVRTFEETGCGYYPNSIFVHMDVRDTKGYWVDRSGPGEPADYGPWPPPKKEVDPMRDDILREAFADLAQLGKVREPDTRTAIAVRPVAKVREPHNEADDMTPEEIARVRDEARRAIEQM